MGKKHCCFLQTAETENRTLNSSVKGSGANHYPKAPAQIGPGEPPEDGEMTLPYRHRIQNLEVLRPGGPEAEHATFR